MPYNGIRFYKNYKVIKYKKVDWINIEVVGKLQYAGVVA